MRLSWNEVRNRAAAFSRDFADASYERGQCHIFYTRFFEVFGMRVERVASFEAPVKKLGEKRGYIDLFWKGVLLIEQKSAGRSLQQAREQAFDYFPGLSDEELPRYLLLSDFQTFELLRLDTEETWTVPLSELSKHAEVFGFIMGVERRTFHDQDPVDIAASELLGRLYDELEASRFVGHDLELFLVRILFCLFADDTGIFSERGALEAYLRSRVKTDASNLGALLAELFQVLNTPVERRFANLDEDLAAFPYINGGLFTERTSIPSLDTKMQGLLFDAMAFDWQSISPAIFGSLFQFVQDKEARRAVGAHYTTEKNIQKVLGPLFLDDLKAELHRLEQSRSPRRDADLRRLHDRVARLKVFDPACGCGNFLVVAYRELRKLEIRILHALHQPGQLALDVRMISRIDVDQFYGIEIDEFPARIAEVALWMMDHFMNNEMSLTFGQTFLRIPLSSTPHIVHGNALEMDWTDLLAPSDDVVLLGNPPFIGKHLQSDAQKTDMQAVFSGWSGYKSLDYVAAWYVKSVAYMRHSPQMRAAFVSTNSITQGEQVPILWGPLLEQGVSIFFGHRSFAWGSDARGAAQVHVVIIGFTLSSDIERRTLFDYAKVTDEPQAYSAGGNISPYLVAYNNLIIEKRRSSVSGAPRIRYGSKPVDGGHLLFSESEAEAFVQQCPGARKFLREMVSAHEFMHGQKRYCLWLVDAEPSELKALAPVKQRLKAVRAFRAGSKKAATREAADRPGEFAELRQPQTNYIVIPMHTTSTRYWVPLGFFDKDVIVHNSCTCVESEGRYEFGVLSSTMHMTWLRYTGGRIASGYRYSNTLVYNTFPWPQPTQKQRARIDQAAADLLSTRAAYTSALGDLYEPDQMPAKLSRAHKALDRAVDRAYRVSDFPNERARIEFLFSHYEKLLALG